MTDYAAVESGMASKGDLPRFRQGEVGTIGLKVWDGTIYEERRRDLRWPHNINTYKNMSLDPVVDSVMKVISAYMKTVKFEVVPASDSAEDKARAEFIESCMHDMDRSWSEYIQEFLSYLLYGYNVSEKVFKIRRGSSKELKYASKFSDELVGWAKLPTRSQDTLDRWIFDEKQRDLLAVRQNLNLVLHGPRTFTQFDDREAGWVVLPRKKFLLFRADAHRDNPQGTSPLNGAYIAWRNKIGVEESELIGASRDLRGMPIMRLPSKYLSESATPDQQAFAAEMRRILRNLQVNEQAGLQLPSDRDDKGNLLFDFELAAIQGGRQNNTDDIIKRLENKILMSFMADVLKAGQDSVGSFALADSKTALLAVGIESRLIEMLDTINNDLIPHTFELNSWSTEAYPKIVYGDLDEVSLDELGKFIQRLGAAGVIENDKALANWAREKIGLPPADPANPADEELIAGGSSRAGEGMEEGMPSGTGQSTGNNSTNNSDNAE